MTVADKIELTAKYNYLTLRFGRIELCLDWGELDALEAEIKKVRAELEKARLGECNCDGDCNAYYASDCVDCYCPCHTMFQYE